MIVPWSDGQATAERTVASRDWFCGQRGLHRPSLRRENSGVEIGALLVLRHGECCVRCNSLETNQNGRTHTRCVPVGLGLPWSHRDHWILDSCEWEGSRTHPVKVMLDPAERS